MSPTRECVILILLMESLVSIFGNEIRISSSLDEHRNPTEAATNRRYDFVEAYQKAHEAAYLPQATPAKLFERQPQLLPLYNYNGVYLNYANQLAAMEQQKQPSLLRLAQHYLIRKSNKAVFLLFFKPRQFDELTTYFIERVLIAAGGSTKAARKFFNDKLNIGKAEQPAVEEESLVKSVSTSILDFVKYLTGRFNPN